LQNDYLDSEEFQEILETYESALAEGRTPYFDVDDFADISDYYMNEDKPEKAMECVEMGLERYPGEQSLLLIKSGVLIFIHKFEEAEAILADIDTSNNEAMYQKAQLEYALYKNTEKAERMFEEWIEGERDYAENEEDFEDQREEYIRDSYIHVINSFVELSDDYSYDKKLVEKWVEKYLELFSPLGEYESDLALADTVRNESMYELVVKIYTNLLETNPYINHGWTVLAAAQLTLYDFDNALDSVEYALAIDPNNMDAIVTKAMCLYNKENYEDAAVLFEKYLKSTNDASQTLTQASCYMHLNDEKNALRCLHAAEHFYGRYSDNRYLYANVCFEIADVYFCMNMKEEARKFLDRALLLSPNETGFLLMDATLKMAEKRYAEAVPQFLRFVENQDDVVDAVIAIVSRLILFKMDDTALELLDLVEKREEGNRGVERIYPYKALIYLRDKDDELAAKYMEMGIEKCRELTEDVLKDYVPMGMTLERYVEVLGRS